MATDPCSSEKYHRHIHQIAVQHTSHRRSSCFSQTPRKPCQPETKTALNATFRYQGLLTHNFLRRVLFPGKYPGRLVVESQRVVGARVSADIVLIVRLQDQVGARATEEVDLEFPCRAQGIHGLGDHPKMTFAKHSLGTLGRPLPGL